MISVHTTDRRVFELADANEQKIIPGDIWLAQH